MPPFVERSIFNPKTKKYFGFSDFWLPIPCITERISGARSAASAGHLGRRPLAGSRLKAQGHPVGIGMGDDLESNITLVGLMHGFGASIQDEEANVVINSRATIEAVKIGSAIFRSAMTDEVLGWDITSNNRYLDLRSGVADPELHRRHPGPRGAGPGPGGQGRVAARSRRARGHAEPLRRRHLRHLEVLREPGGGEAVPGGPGDRLPGAVHPEPVSPAARRSRRHSRISDALVANDARAQPPGKYGLLAGAAGWTTNVGHPGHSNAAADEVIRAAIISQMFAAAARGEMSAEEVGPGRRGEDQADLREVAGAGEDLTGPYVRHHAACSICGGGATWPFLKVGWAPSFGFRCPGKSTRRSNPTPATSTSRDALS